MSGGGGTNQPVEVDGAPTTDPELRGGVLFRFAETASGNGPGENFTVWSTHNPSINLLIATFFGSALPVNHITATFVNGEGEADHNNPWTWHVDPARRIRINVFSGAPVFLPPFYPSLIETDPDTYITTQEQTMFCTLLGFDDRR